MAQEQATQMLQQGIAAARAGQADAARQLFRQAARLDPRNEAAWQWLITVAEDNNERIFCLKQLLSINPQNERAREALQRLGTEAAAPAAAPAVPQQQRPATPPPPPGTISVPVLDDDKYTRLQQAADDFLRRYNPEPVDRLNIRWVQKQRGRYGEGGATRLRRAMYATAALVLVVLVGGVIFLASQVDLPFVEGTESAQRATRIPSLTPTLTLTPTMGGPTPTPFPDSMDVLATSVPEGVEPGDPYRLMTPTEIYPRVEVDVKTYVEQGASYYSIGDYTSALEKLQEGYEALQPQCYPSLVYFMALSQAGMGNYQQAENTIQEALSADVPRSYLPLCQDSPLLIAGLGEIAYRQDSQSQNALTYSEQALAANIDPPLVQASLTKAQVELARGDITAARGTVTQARVDWPQDTNLLLLAAQIELADNQPQVALEYVSTAVYIEPASQPALYLQSETYLRLAEQAQGNTARLQYYGLAAISAQTLLQYHSGDPAGYLYLAMARMGEGNTDLAETELNRILAAEDSLPASARSIVRDAHHIRGELYYGQGRFAEARDDFEQVAFTGPGRLDPEMGEKLVHIALQLGEYAEAENWLSQLLAIDSTNASYLLLQARVMVEICTFYPDELTCEYRDMLDELTDDFVATLSTERERADAYSYRAQAQYWDTQQRGLSLSEGDRQLAYQLALNDLTQALAVRESPVDHYYRGLILEDLNEPVRAYDEYQWLLYWNDVYPYPFKDNAFESRVEQVAEVVQEIVGAEAVTPASTERPEETPTPRPTSTPRPTPTPTPEPTALPPDQIP